MTSLSTYSTFVFVAQEDKSKNNITNIAAKTGAPHPIRLIGDSSHSSS
jgi:hypothetical protein